MAVIDSRTPGVLSVLSETNTADPTDALRSFVATACGYDLKDVRKRWVQKPGVRPPIAEDWAAVGITTMEIQGTDAYKGTRGEDDNIQSQFTTIVSHQKLHGIATFYGPDCLLYADRFRMAAMTPQNNDYLSQQAGVVFQDIDETLVRTPEQLLEQWVDRVDVRFVLGRRVERVLGIRNIGSFDGIEIITEKGTLNG